MRSALFLKKAPATDAEFLRLKEAFLQARRDLSQAYGAFDQAVDPALVESCIYKINAEQARCDYFLRAIKLHTAARTASQDGRDTWI